ncbi:LCP family protein [Candidatus Woesebacteria bacterium]|nr:LCP family protein [Candidatus Woesebacteria bacterium]
MQEPSPRKLQFRSKRKKGAQIKPFVAVIIAFFGVACAIYAASQFKTFGTSSMEFTAKLQPTPTPYYQNIVLLGYGGGSHEGGALTDSIIVARIDDKVQKVFLISIPRDLWIDLPIEKNGGMSGQKINAAYALGLDDTWFPNKPTEYRVNNGGGGNLAKYALEQVIGEKIDHFGAVSFQAFTSFIDTLGGITITRQTPFVDAWFPIEDKEKETCEKSEEDLKQIEATLSGYLREQAFPCRYETLSLGVGTHTLDGETALKYVRSRHSEFEGGDFYRSQRQRQVINAIKEKTLTIAAVPKLVEFAQSIYKYIDTDYTLDDVTNLIKLALAKKDYAIESIALTNDNVLKDGVGPNGEYMLIPRTGEGDFASIQQYLFDRYRGVSEASASAKFNSVLTPTATPKKNGGE